MNTAASLLYAVAASVLLALGWAVSGHTLTHEVAAIALGGGAIAGLFAWWRGWRHRFPLERPRGWGWVPVVLYTLFALRCFLWLVWREKNELRVLSPNNLGDLSIHLTFIEYFRSGVSFWPDSPIFANGKLSYGIGMDFFNSLLALVGVDPLRGLVAVGLAGAILSGLALWRWGGPFTLMGFLCMGGLLGFAAFAQGDTQPFFQDYAGNLKFDWAWKSLPLAILVTQRGFLFALPAGLLLLSSWRTRFFGVGGWRMPFLGELLLYASMPVFHIHTFIVLSFLLACFFLCHVAARWKVAALVGAALVPATVLVWFTTGMGQANALPMWENMEEVEHPPGRPVSKVLGWQPGWMVNEPTAWDAWESLSAGKAPALDPHGRFLTFWLGNFGAWPFAAGALLLVLLRRLASASIPASLAWWSALVFVVVTPLLGLSPRLAHDSLTQIFFGRNLGAVARCALPTAVALGSLICAALLRGARPEMRTLRFAVYTFAAIVAIDGSLVAISQAGLPVPLLPANTLPLLLATAAFLNLLLRIAQRADPSLWATAFALPALYLFFLCCNVLFAPSAWDNTKLMIWAALIAMPFIWEFVLRERPLKFRAAACFLLFFSGFVALLGGMGREQPRETADAPVVYRQGYVVAELRKIDAMRAATKNLPVSEPIACAPLWNSPVLLSGRKAVIGYTSHVTSHGIDLTDQLEKLETLMEGRIGWRLAAAQLGVRYLWWGEQEEHYWPHSRQSWREAVQPVAYLPNGVLYDLERPRVPLDDFP